MHFLNTFLLSVLALALSPALSAPILPNVDSLEARSIGDGSVDKRFIPDPAAAVTLLQSHQRSLAVEKRGSEAPLISSSDGRDYPHFVIPQHPVTQPEPANPTPATSNDKSKHISRRDAGSDATETEKRKRPLGRIVHLGKKLARLFYHPSHKHATTSQTKVTSHRVGQTGDKDNEDGDDSTVQHD